MSRAKMLGNIASVTALRIGMAALGFGLFWLLSHRLPTAELGGYSVLMNTFFMVQALPLLGLNARLIRHIAAQPASLAMELSNSLIFALPGAALIAVGLSTYGWTLEGSSLFLPYMLLGLAMLPTAWILVAESALVGREAVPSVCLCEPGRSLGALAGRLAGGQSRLGADGGVCLLFDGTCRRGRGLFAQCSIAQAVLAAAEHCHAVQVPERSAHLSWFGGVGGYDGAGRCACSLLSTRLARCGGLRRGGALV